MASRTRRIWIVAIAAVVLACCGMAILAGGAVTWAARRTAEWGPVAFGAPYTERSDRVFDAPAEPGLDITNFAGSVSVRAGQPGVIRVEATRQAANRSQVDRIEVSMSQQGTLLVVRTRKLADLTNGAVHLEVTAPANTRVEVHTGAGTVDVRGISGSVDVYSGAGSIAVREAMGAVRLGLGVGEIEYEGTPSGRCSFDTGLGEIRLSLPSAPDVTVDLTTGIGQVEVGFSVQGQVRLREVRGKIGAGGDAYITAHTGAGAIRVGR